ncbi:MAG TPA: 16S rRNA (guanine(527)-N(7))-methyltransferase RsmG [Candidatus Limnocylindrales bacterium]|nr:16S rRNA (guanine(527)-N(7))-methyltransferase RsmG [Candidatus Limnocylindrales bacterium]
MSSTDAAARLAREAFEELLATELPTVGATLPGGYAMLAERYVALLLDANARLNLTRVVEPDAVARLHLLDAVAALPILDASPPGRALDLGTGGGVPGILLAAARPGVRWTLVDSVHKKVAEVGAFATALGLANVEALAGRAEALGRDPARREAYDLVTARACAALPVLAEYALPLLRAGGTLLAWKGAIGADELRAGSEAASLLGGGEPRVRATEAASLGDHRFVVVRKERPTPRRYPRRPGEPSRRPLAS